MMMGGFGMFGLFFGLLFMLFFFVAIGAVGVWVLRQITSTGVQPTRGVGSNISATVSRQCPTCGRSMQPEWAVCPYDGTPLTS